MQPQSTPESMLLNGKRAVNPLKDLFVSPEWYPLEMDLERRLVTFLRMSPAAYRGSVFHAARAARRFGKDAFQMRLDDVLLAAATAPTVERRVHFILHCAFCCSTLLARYLELLPATVVLKEPQWITQMAMVRSKDVPDWIEIFDLSLRLLTRTYHPDEMSVIKTNIPCNPLGGLLLERDPHATVTFLMTPMREFVLAALKSEFRQGRIRSWNRDLREGGAVCPRPLAGIESETLPIELAAAYFWLQTRSIATDLSSGPYRSRVVVLNGKHVADSPEEVLPAVAALCGRTLNEEQLTHLVNHPAARQHSKFTFRSYDADSRRQDMGILEKQFGEQADAAVDWAMSLGVDSAWMNVPETDAIACGV